MVRILVDVLGGVHIAIPSLPKVFFDSLNENHSECPNNILEQNGMELNGTLPSEEVNEVTMDQLRASQVS